MKKIGAIKRGAEIITPYELQRLKNCMRNKARIEALGIPTARNEFNTMVLQKSAKASKGKDPEHSESEYDPGDDPSGEGDQSDDNQTESSKKTAPIKNAQKRTSDDMSPGGISPRAAKKTCIAKRAAPATAQPTRRVTRSQKASRSDSGVIIHPTSLLPASFLTPPVSPEKAVNNVEQQRTQHTAQDDAIHQQDDQVPLTTEEHNAGDDCAQSDNAIHQEDDQVPLTTEEHNAAIYTEEERCIRGQNMGRGLQKITRARRAKLPVVINEGKTRPFVPLIAAKFATECNITVRNHLPVFKHWKEYKKHPVLLEQFMGSLKLKFDMNSNDGSVKHACNLMMKSALRQQRYRLKKKFFDPFPLHLVPRTSPVKSLDDAQWQELVEYWKNPKRMTTGSRSYVVHLENLGDKYQNEDPNALDLFKECHHSRKKGYTAAVQSAITELENKISESTEAQDEESVNTLVAEYLAEQTKNSKFLQNVGLGKVQATASVRKLEAQLAAEKSANADLQLLVSKQREQIDVLSMKFQESEQARITDKAETDKKLELLLSRLNSV